MKKIFLVIAMLFACSLFAEESVLFKADALGSTSVEEYSFENWEVIPQSSLSARTQIKMTDKGLGVCVELRKRDGYVSYKIVPPYSPSLNEPNKELGFIENVGEIKSIKLTAEGILKADEVTIYLSRSKTDFVGKPYKFKKNIAFIGEGELVWENPAYISDPAKRDKEPGPAYGDEASNLYIRAIEVRTKCDWPVSVAYFKDLTVIYDLDKTPEELERIKESEEIWGINAAINSKIEDKAKKDLQEKKRKLEYNTELMHKENESDAK
jgi:hypothetical protein